MKTELDHLPPHKRQQILEIAARVRAAAAVEMIVLFGSYARGDWVEDLVHGYLSDYDFMIVVEDEKLAQDDAFWAAVANDVAGAAGRVPVTLLVHDIKHINREIRTGQYFFADVVKEGVLLHDSKRFSLARPKAQTPEERLDIALQNFRYWFGSANEFWVGARFYAARALGAHAAFSLHQATERYFHATLLVYQGYKPKTHDIALLATQTSSLHEALPGALPREAPEDERLFQLLRRAYIEARYTKSYRVTDDELEVLFERVLDLSTRVRRACLDKLVTIADRAELPALPESPSFEPGVELPKLASLDDAQAVAEWRDAMVRVSLERGERLRREGRAAGRVEGEVAGRVAGREEGRLQERAMAILDVLRHRGVAIEETDAERILGCRDEATLARWWGLVWSVSAAGELTGT